MKVVIDASVWVSSVKNDETNYQVSLAFLQRVRMKSIEVYCPSIVKAECASAIMRSTKMAERADALIARIERFSLVQFRSVDDNLIFEAIEIIRKCTLRGYDSIYAALAKHEDAPLISWDEEFIKRKANIFQAMKPNQWLATNG
jgi:predicted nucleic acid-binding protein